MEPAHSAGRSGFGSPAAYWLAELNAWHRQARTWYTTGAQIVDRYRLAHTQGRESAWSPARQINLLYSNVQTLLPALYGQQPVPVVERRFRDADPDGRLAAAVMQRALANTLDGQPAFDAAVTSAILDLLLCGRGVLWVRYEPQIEVQLVPVVAGDEGLLLTEDGTAVSQDDTRLRDQGDGRLLLAEETLLDERVVVDHVYWRDLAHAASARSWMELTREGWVGRRTLLTREAGLARFGSQFSLVPAVSAARRDEGTTTPAPDDRVSPVLDRHEVWEIWDATRREVVWLAPAWPEQLLDRQPPPVEVEGFYPAVVLYGTTSNENLIPTPDYEQYRTFAEELDLLTERIAHLLDALRVRGAYDASLSGLGALLSGATADLSMVAIRNAKDQNLSGAIQWVPIDSIVGVLRNLYAARDAAKQDLFEVSGLSDVIRGQVDPREKAAQSRIKAQAAGERIGRQQKAVGAALAHLLRIAAEILAETLDPDRLRRLSGYDFLPEIAAAPETADIRWQTVVGLLRQDRLRSYRVGVDTQTTAWVDQPRQAQERQEFLAAVGAFLSQSVPLAQAAPGLVPLLGELLLFAVRSHGAGRTLEAKFEETIRAMVDAAPPAPPPAGVVPEPGP